MKIANEIATAQWIDEHMKATDPLRQVQEMNAAKYNAEEFVLQDFYEQIR